MIQTHLIICKDWTDTKDKVKSLEHIICKCNPSTTSMPLVTTAAAVPGLYSYVTHYVNKDETEIPPPFKGAKPKQNWGRGKPKGKPQKYLKVVKDDLEETALEFEPVFMSTMVIL